MLKLRLDHLLVMLAAVQVLADDICGAFHCTGLLSQCCSDELGEEYCCTVNVLQQFWFWILIGLGTVVLAVAIYCMCRTFYRYHNASQYTKLCQQQFHVQTNYGTNSCVPLASNIPPPPVYMTPADYNNSQLPSYESVLSGPPAYSQ